MGIRGKILFGFLVLAGMLFLAGGWSIYELMNIGTSVQGLLDDNYRSINAARSMVEALEREDSAILLLISGKRQEGTEIIKNADLSFQQAFMIAQKNITIPGEKSLVDDIEKAYDAFKVLWSEPIIGTDREGNLDQYFRKEHQSFLGVKSEIRNLMTLNDRFMYQTASDLKNRAYRAIMPGIVAIIAALVFSFVFNYFVNYYLVGPIIRISHGIQDFLDTGKTFEVNIETMDEMSLLASSLQQLISRSSNRDEKS